MPIKSVSDYIIDNPNAECSMCGHPASYHEYTSDTPNCLVENCDCPCFVE